MNNDDIINKILNLAKKAERINEFPVGAVIVQKGKIVSTGYNKREKTNVTFNHAEVIAVGKANKALNRWRLNDCDLYVTLEPCEMCKTIIKEARINKVYYLVSRNEEKKQYSKSLFNHYKCDKNNVDIDEYKTKIESFFLDKR